MRLFKEENEWVVKATITNFGQTPAKHTIWRRGFNLTSFPEGEATDFLVFKKSKAVGDIAPTGKYSTSFPILLTDNIVRVLENKGAIFFVWGRVEFRDAFDDERWMTFRAFVGGPHGFEAKGGSMSLADEGNDSN